MRLYTFCIFVWGLLLGGTTVLQAQRLDPTPGQSIFTVRGYGHSGLEFRQMEGENRWKNSFVGGSFNPIFLWRQSDRLIFEAELEFGFEENRLEVGLEYADVAYTLNRYLIARFGEFLLPFGKFTSNFHPAWINRLSTAPLGFGHHDPVGPATDFGFELRGATPVGVGKFTYALYVVNGPALQEDGRLVYGLIEDNNTNKAVGGRISWLPLSDLSLEVGLSAQYGKVGASESAYEHITARLYAVDLTFRRNLIPLNSMLDIRGQYNRAEVDRTSYPGPTPGEMISFDNTSQAYYIQGSLRPAYVENPLLKNLEFVSRYSKLMLPEEAPWGEERSEVALGINYWIDWRTVVKFSYLTMDIAEGHEEAEQALPKRFNEGEEDEEAEVLKQAFMIHIAIGF